MCLSYILGINILTNCCTLLFSDNYVHKQHFSSFIFSFVFQQKYVEVEINDFTMHQIFLKWLRKKNTDRGEKQLDKRGRGEKRNCQ